MRMLKPLYVATRIRKIPLTARSDRPADPRLSGCGYERCLQCGRCTASCPAAYAYGDYSPRMVMNRLSMGDAGSLGESIWKCGQCYSCKSRCPRNNSAAAAVLALREEALRRGLVPESIRRVAIALRRNLYERGETFLPGTLTKDALAAFGPRTAMRCSGNLERRVRLGYERDDARACRIPDGSMAEIRHILEATGCREEI